jgi:hypothetical protein
MSASWPHRSYLRIPYLGLGWNIYNLPYRHFCSLACLHLILPFSISIIHQSPLTDARPHVGEIMPSSISIDRLILHHALPISYTPSWTLRTRTWTLFVQYSCSVSSLVFMTLVPFSFIDHPCIIISPCCRPLYSALALINFPTLRRLSSSSKCIDAVLCCAVYVCVVTKLIIIIPYSPLPDSVPVAPLRLFHSFST